MVEQETRKKIEEQKGCRALQDSESLKQIAINLARIVDRLDDIERSARLAKRDC